MNKKKLVYLVMTCVMILLMASGSMTILQPTTAAPTGPTSATVDGNLGTDTYTLYPFNQTSLNFGFTQYGEMIDPVTNTGLSYNGVDAFANPYVPTNQWSEGWLINITFSYLTAYFNVWAFALYSNVISGAVGGNWIWSPSSTSTTAASGRVYGGYMYNTSSGTLSPIGYVSTAPITVLYNGPRSYIALCNTTIGIDSTTPLVSVLLTYIFDKVNKVVIVEKDVKMLYYNKWSGTVLHVEFGDRGEWDLGNIPTGPYSYAYVIQDQCNSYEYGYQPFYNNTTPAYYDVVQIIPSDTTVTPNVGFEAFWPTPISMYVQDTSDVGPTVEESLSTNTAYFTGNGTNTTFKLPVTATYFPIGNGAWSNDPIVFVNGLEVPSSSYSWTGSNTVTFTIAPASGSSIWIVYNAAVTHPTMSVEPAYAPYVIGEWVFDLSWSNVTASTNQFEGITCYGQTGYNTATNGNYASNLDSEVNYQLAQVFNPFDLTEAVEKQTDRWVEYSADPIGSTNFTTSINNLPVLVVGNLYWDQYAQFSERVEDLTNGTVLNRALGQYGFIALSDGQAEFTGLDPTHAYKFLYSTDPYYPSDDILTFTLLSTTSPNDTVNESPTHEFMPSIEPSWRDPTGIVHELTANFDDEDWGISFTNMSTTSFTANYTWPTATTNFQEWNAQPFVLYKENRIDLSTGTMTIFNTTVGGGETGLPQMQIEMNQLFLNWFIYNDYTEFQNFYDTYFCQFNPDFQVSITVSYNVNTTLYTVSATLKFESDQFGETYEGAPIYAYHLPGRYEEGVVGTSAASVDSAGLAMVTAAFKDKGVEYGLSAGDTFAGTSTSQIPNQMPYVMSPTSTGTSWANYYYTDGSFRTGLMDDWGTSSLENWGYSWPVSSANMIVVGGPLANLAAYYANDFETAFYGLSQFTTYATWQNAIIPLTAYNAPETGYTDNATVGYGVISTVMDLNGTVQFLIWGNWGRDTFYLSQWFQQEGIFELQCAPCGLTSIVVQITYQSTTQGYQPTGYNVVNCLGTISERPWAGINAYGTPFVKGGWHPDP
jgi:hypothetical protein